MSLQADILDAEGDIIGDGTITLISATLARPLDGSGSLRFDCPEDIRARQLLTAGRSVRIWYDYGDSVEVFAEGVINRASITSSGKMNVDGNDLLQELKYRITLPNLTYNGTTVQATASSLISALGWTVEAYGTALTQTVVERFEDAVSLLRAVIMVCEHSGTHLRLRPDVARVLQVGSFGTWGNITLIDGPSGEGGDRSSGRIADLTISEQADIVNWLIPIGAEGLTLEDSTHPNKRSLTGPDGNPVYYVADDESIAVYGLRQAQETYPDVRALSAAPADMIAGSNLLAVSALTTLANKSVIRRDYRGKVYGLRSALLPGDSVRVIYAGQVYREEDGTLWPGGTIDEYLYIIRSEMYAGEGGTWQTVELSNVNALKQDAVTDINFAVEQSKKAF